MEYFGLPAISDEKLEELRSKNNIIFIEDDSIGLCRRARARGRGRRPRDHS